MLTVVSFWAAWVAITTGSGSLFSEAKTQSETDIISENAHSEQNKMSGFGAPWLAWHEGPCSVSCSIGVLTRKRNCSNDNPQTAAETCIGFHAEVDLCMEAACPVIDGGWTSWAHQACSVTCGNGTQDETRSCTNPKPESGGKDCDGPSNRTVGCSTPECPVNGEWSSWVANTCSVECGAGITMRKRTCTNPPPQNGGTECQGLHEEVVECNGTNCPVDGGWTTWSESCIMVTDCNGVNVRSRMCTNPQPQFGGSQCQGTDTEHSTCDRFISNQHECIQYNTNVWLAASGSCIYVGNELRSEAMAKSICQDMCGGLVKIKDALMLHELQGHLNDGDWYRIDGSDAWHEGSWINSGGNAMWASWHPGEPNGGSGQNCVYVHGAPYHYADFICTPEHHYICAINTR